MINIFFIAFQDLYWTKLENNKVGFNDKNQGIEDFGKSFTFKTFQVFKTWKVSMDFRNLQLKSKTNENYKRRCPKNGFGFILFD